MQTNWVLDKNTSNEIVLKLKCASNYNNIIPILKTYYQVLKPSEDSVISTKL